MSEKMGKILGWIGIVVGVVGFFWLSIWLGIVSMVLGIAGMFSPQKKLNGIALAAGVVALIIGLV